MRPTYVASEVATNLRRNVLMTTAAVMTVAVSLALVGASFLTSYAVQRATARWRGGVELSIFLNPDVTETQRQAVESQLKETPQVKSYTYVDQEAAFEEAKNIFHESPDILSAITAQDLPPSYRVVPNNPEDVETISAQFENGFPAVFRVSSAKEQVKTLVRMTNAFRIFFYSLSLILAGSAIMLILNTIRMAIFSRRREVAVMKLVGATNWFIRVPFMLEGLLQGLFGGLVAFLLVWPAWKVAIGRLHDYELFKQFFVTDSQLYSTGIWLLLLGAVLGGIGSMVAVSRFLDV